MRDIKQFLPFYFEQWVMVKDLRRNLPEKESLDGKWALSHQILGHAMMDDIEVKPFLRSLSDMTEEEAKEVGNLAFITSNEKPFNSKNWKLHLHEFANEANHVTIVLEDNPLMNIDDLWSQPPAIRRSNDGFQSVPLVTHIIIHPNFRIEHHTPFNLNNWKGARPQQYIFQYLLSRGFDLFNLIPDNLALDSKLVNH